MLPHGSLRDMSPLFCACAAVKSCGDLGGRVITFWFPVPGTARRAIGSARRCPTPPAAPKPYSALKRGAIITEHAAMAMSAHDVAVVRRGYRERPMLPDNRCSFTALRFFQARMRSVQEGILPEVRTDGHGLFLRSSRNSSLIASCCGSVQI